MSTVRGAPNNINIRVSKVRSEREIVTTNENMNKQQKIKTIQYPAKKKQRKIRDGWVKWNVWNLPLTNVWTVILSCNFPFRRVLVILSSSSKRERGESQYMNKRKGEKSNRGSWNVRRWRDVERKGQQIKDTNTGKGAKASNSAMIHEKNKINNNNNNNRQLLPVTPLL